MYVIGFGMDCFALGCRKWHAGGDIIRKSRLWRGDESRFRGMACHPDWAEAYMVRCCFKNVRASSHVRRTEKTSVYARRPRMWKCGKNINRGKGSIIPWDLLCSGKFNIQTWAFAELVCSFALVLTCSGGRGSSFVFVWQKSKWGANHQHLPSHPSTRYGSQQIQFTQQMKVSSGYVQPQSSLQQHCYGQPRSGATGLPFFEDGGNEGANELWEIIRKISRTFQYTVVNILITTRELINKNIMINCKVIIWVAEKRINTRPSLTNGTKLNMGKSILILLSIWKINLSTFHT